MEAKAHDPAVLPETLMLFDGDCAVCDATVQFVLDRDPDGVVHFAPLQGETAAAVLERHPELPEDLDSIVLVQQTPEGETVTVHSHAIFHLVRHVKGPYKALAIFRFFPRFLTDAGYKAFAAMRYRIFGKVEQCRIPEPGQAERFLP